MKANRCHEFGCQVCGDSFRFRRNRHRAERSEVDLSLVVRFFAKSLQLLVYVAASEHGEPKLLFVKTPRSVLCFSDFKRCSKMWFEISRKFRGPFGGAWTIIRFMDVETWGWTSHEP